MAMYGVSVVVTILAWDLSANDYKTGDAANIVLKWLKDGTNATTTNACSEVDATNSPGVYKVTLTAAEAQCLVGVLSGKSSTANIRIIPIIVTFDQIPNAVPGANGGLPTTDASNRVTANTTQFAGQTVTAAAGVTLPTSVASPTNITAASGIALTAAYDAAKTASQAGDAMALTSGERTTLAASIWNALTSGITTANSIGKRIVDYLTGDIYARIGAPAGASISADIATRMATFTLPVNFSALSISGAGLVDILQTAADKAWSTAARTLTDKANFTLADGSITTAKFAVGAIDSTVISTNAKTAIATAVGALTPDGTITLLQAMQIMMGVLAGKLSGATTGTITIRDINDTRNLIVAITDANGNRSSVTLTLV